MNKWQKIYCENLYDGKFPRTKIGKQEVDILGNVKDEVIVQFPDFKGLHGITPAHTAVYKVTENEDDVPNGLMSVCTLARNLSLWLSRGYKIQTK